MTAVLKNCRKCNRPFEPSAHQLKKWDYLYTPCRKAYFQSYRDSLRAKGLVTHHKKYPGIERREQSEEIFREAVRNKTRFAIRSGKLQRLPCEVCGKQPADAHHEDYNKPLDVNWLCSKHHAERHAQLREIQYAKGLYSDASK